MAVVSQTKLTTLATIYVQREEKGKKSDKFRVWNKFQTEVPLFLKTPEVPYKTAKGKKGKEEYLYSAILVGLYHTHKALRYGYCLPANYTMPSFPS